MAVIRRKSFIVIVEVLSRTEHLPDSLQEIFNVFEIPT